MLTLCYNTKPDQCKWKLRLLVENKPCRGMRTLHLNKRIQLRIRRSVKLTWPNPDKMFPDFPHTIFFDRKFTVLLYRTFILCLLLFYSVWAYFVSLLCILNGSTHIVHEYHIFILIFLAIFANISDDLIFHIYLDL